MVVAGTVYTGVTHRHDLRGFDVTLTLTLTDTAGRTAMTAKPVTVAPAVGPVIGEDLPRDLTGDGLLRDVDGDGDIVDIQGLFDEL